MIKLPLFFKHAIKTSIVVGFDYFFQFSNYARVNLPDWYSPFAYVYSLLTLLMIVILGIVGFLEILKNVIIRVHKKAFKLATTMRIE